MKLSVTFISLAILGLGLFVQAAPVLRPTRPAPDYFPLPKAPERSGSPTPLREPKARVARPKTGVVAPATLSVGPETDDVEGYKVHLVPAPSKRPSSRTTERGSASLHSLDARTAAIASLPHEPFFQSQKLRASGYQVISLLPPEVDPSPSPPPADQNVDPEPESRPPTKERRTRGTLSANTVAGAPNSGAK